MGRKRKSRGIKRKIASLAMTVCLIIASVTHLNAQESEGDTTQISFEYDIEDGRYIEDYLYENEESSLILEEDNVLMELETKEAWHEGIDGVVELERYAIEAMEIAPFSTELPLVVPGDL
jgi:hypothetical protein